MADPVDPSSASACVVDGSAIGMPQLCADWYLNQIFWLLVALVAIYFVLTRIALPRVGAVLAERSGTISNDLAAAEDLKRQAVDAEAAYEKALADARAEAQRISAEARAAIQADLNAAIAKADAQIAEKTAESEAQIAEIRAGASASVAEVARDVAGEIVRALGGKPDQGAIDAAVDTRVKGS
ncbi:F0F1 ATP synthase subunit B' [Jannaschia seohaensis]|uniref:ATP synthase subunit b n=1 Tax=Jannaschia seohaensis TaxID=475081 RepID=A0A2Y9ANN0_9RHOB|nr:F0F1 ATP synthase subunit B' [Jannaschia seohaensis]PWJ19105.1 F-type H+-transporting ATPase subunit b [Jannaschia seohaensis]SSA45735.1 F-type H+-transporting ATPase subunit b [Jannaschia seohaensis]